MKSNRLLLAVTFMSVFLFGSSLYGQQEVDPTWYNPWPVANKTTESASQVAKPKNPTKTVSRASEPKAVSRASERQSKMLREKQSVTQQADLRVQPDGRDTF